MKLRFTRQFDQMDCGPACIRMVASAYGKDYPLSYLRSLSHLTREGVSVAGIRDALKAIGMESATFEMTPEQLHEKCPLPLPMGALAIGLWHVVWHAIVAHRPLPDPGNGGRWYWHAGYGVYSEHLACAGVYLCRHLSHGAYQQPCESVYEADPKVENLQN